MTGEYFFAAGVSALDGSGDVETANAAGDVLYTFDDLGRTATITDSTGVTTDSYDADGNLIKQVKPEGTINYVDDPATGRLMETWTGTDRGHEGTDTSYAYDAQGRLSTTTVTVLNGVTLSAAQITVDTYDAEGNKATELLPNGLLTTYTYNGQDQLTGEAVTKGGTDVFTQQYTLAANGRRDAVNETQYNADGSVFSSVQTNWGYDNLDRLTSEDYTSSVAGQSYADAFSYDLVGNRLTKTHDTSGNDESIAYTYNNDDQLLTETGTLNGSPEYATTYGYDANGSLTSKTRTGASPETDTYTYNLQNQLASSTVNAVTTTYATDAAGDRVSVTTGGTTTTSVVDDNNLTGYSQVLEQSTGGNITTSYIIGDRVLGQGSAGTPSYLVVDGQGSTRLVTDTAGAVTARYSFDAFGNALGFTASGAVTSFLYTGQQFDAGLGEYNLRARYYDPGTGTFTSFDSADNGDADPRDLHKYLYAGANPVNAYDPSGHYTQAFGYAAHEVIGAAYEATHPYSIINATTGVFSALKPDIYDPLNRGYAEIKPLSFPGVTSGLLQIVSYDGVYGPRGELGLGYHRITDWPASPTFATVVAADGESDEIVYFNVDGLIFYTNLIEDVEDLKQLRNPSQLYQFLRDSVKEQFENIKETAQNLVKQVLGEEEADLGATEGIATLDSLEGAP
jgi:RHS repeat-associated protein